MPSPSAAKNRTPALAAVRGRGRPPQGPEAQAALRQRLLDATQAVFTQVGYHGLSVEAVIAEAELSRPRFYKHFRNTDEAIDLVIRAVNDSLINALMEVVRSAGSDGRSDHSFAAVEAGLNAWRQWGEDMGPMLRPLFAELHDAHSPASVHRRRTLDIAAAALMQMTEALGRLRPTRLQIDALLNGVEYLGYRYHLETPRDAASWKQTRDAMLRLTLGLLGNADDWGHAPQLAQALQIDLAPHEH